jgi:hypothetical protein
VNDNDDDTQQPQEPPQFEGVYIVDDDTLRLLEVVVGMLHLLAQTQVDEGARENCHIIADELADRFAVSAEDIEVEEIIHGDEVLYRPRGGVMGDEDPEAEGPKPESPEG